MASELKNTEEQLRAKKLEKFRQGVAKENQQISKGEKTKKRIGIVCHVYPDGIGDLMHVATKANPAYLRSIPELKDYEFVYLISCFPLVIDQLKFRDVLVNCGIYQEGGGPFILGLQNLQDPVAEIGENVKKSSEVVECFNQCQAIFNFSTSIMEVVFEKYFGIGKNGPIPFVSIGEHGANLFCKDKHSKYLTLVDNVEARSVSYRHMGASINHYGFYITPPKESLSNAEALSRIKDKNFLSWLFERDVAKIDKKTYSEFLDNSLLIPCYFQDGNAIAMTILMGVMSSEYIMSLNKKKLVFVVNDNNYNPFLITEKFKKHLEHSNIKQITHIKNTKPLQRTITKISDAPSATLEVMVLENFWLEKENYQYLVQASSGFYGCSGDNTLETALSNPTLIPLIQCRKFKVELLKDLLNLAKRHGFRVCSTFLHTFCRLETLSAQKQNEMMTDLQMSAFIKTISMIICKELVEDWSSFIKFIHENYNFARVLPLIYIQALKQAELNNALKLASNGENIPKLEREIKELEVEINRDQDKEFEAILKQIPQGYPIAGNKVDLSLIKLNTEKLDQVLLALKDAGNITSLDFSGNKTCFADHWEKIIKFIADNPRFTEINFSDCSISPTMMKQFVETTKHIPFQSLCFDLNPLISPSDEKLLKNDYTGIRYMTALIKKSIKTLRKLSLSGCNLDDKCVDFLVQGFPELLEKEKKLTLELSMDNFGISNAAKAKFKPFLESGNLKLEEDNVFSNYNIVKQLSAKTSHGPMEMLAKEVISGMALFRPEMLLMGKMELEHAVTDIALSAVTPSLGGASIPLSGASISLSAVSPSRGGAATLSEGASNDRKDKLKQKT